MAFLKILANVIIKKLVDHLAKIGPKSELVDGSIGPADPFGFQIFYMRVKIGISQNFGKWHHKKVSWLNGQLKKGGKWILFQYVMEGKYNFSNDKKNIH